MTPNRLASHAASGIALFTLTALAHAATIVSCPFNAASTGDDIDRGFYIQHYSGSTLDTVTMHFLGDSAESKTLTLTAASGAYDGPVIGTATASVVVPTSPPGASLTFNFGNAPVTPGSTVTFALTLDAGAAPVLFDIGVGPCAGVAETNGTIPPLDSFRRDSVGVLITGASAATAAVPTLSPGALALLALALLGSVVLVPRRFS